VSKDASYVDLALFQMTSWLYYAFPARDESASNRSFRASTCLRAHVGRAPAHQGVSRNHRAASAHEQRISAAPYPELDLPV